MDKKAILKKYEQLKKLGEIDEAVKLLNNVILELPSDSELYFWRGELFQKLGKNSSALNDYSSAIDIQPTVKYYIFRGKLLWDSFHKFEKSVEDFKQALKLDPDSIESNYELCLMYLLNMDVKSALRFSEVLIGLAPDDYRSYICVALCKKQKKDLAAANDAAQRCIKFNPESRLCWMISADCYHGLRDYQSAMKCYEEAIRIHPDAAAYLGLGQVQLKLDLLEESISNFNLARKFELSEAKRIMVEHGLKSANQAKRNK